MRYLVTSKNQTYEGKTFGIRFTNGRAIVDRHTLSPHLKWTLEQVIDLFKRDMPGYTVEKIGEQDIPDTPDTPDPSPAVKAAPRRASSKKAPREEVTV